MSTPSIKVDRQCAKCGQVVRFLDTAYTCARCPTCGWIDWMALYRLSENDRKFLISLKVDPEDI